MIHELMRETRAAEVGIYPPPQTITCREHGEVHAVSYVKHCPDELSCGCRFAPEDVQRCAECGWPTLVAHLAGGAGARGGRCGDGHHGCLAVGG